MDLMVGCELGTSGMKGLSLSIRNISDLVLEKEEYKMEEWQRVSLRHKRLRAQHQTCILVYGNSYGAHQKYLQKNGLCPASGSHLSGLLRATNQIAHAAGFLYNVFKKAKGVYVGIKALF